MRTLAYLVILFLTCYFFGTGVARFQLLLNSEPKEAVAIELDY